MQVTQCLMCCSATACAYLHKKSVCRWSVGWVATESDKQDNSIKLFHSAASEELCEYVSETHFVSCMQWCLWLWWQVTSLFESSVELQWVRAAVGFRSNLHCRYEGNFWSRDKLLVLPQYKKTTEIDLNEAQGQQSVWRRVDRTLRVLLNK